MNKYITLTIDENLNSRLEALAKSTGRKKVFYFRECVEKYIPICEDTYLCKNKKEIGRKPTRMG